MLTLGGVIARNCLLPTPLPSWIHAVCQRVNSLGAPTFNHVLVNEYEAPDAGIMVRLFVLQKPYHTPHYHHMQAHQDGPLYEPCVAILSLGSSAVMRFYHRDGPGGIPATEPCCSVVLPRRSLLVFADAAYSACLHGIDTCAADVLDATVINPWAASSGVRDSAAILGDDAPGLLPREGPRTSLTFRCAQRRAPCLFSTS